ncbi:MAG: bifunctional histidine phosphatase family protein/GNAT family N-acetyltransferase [Oscillospiraceae bacterium]|nr:bifunctional histidine phosphatase family protein/GNAT family N-acetyltransferase [Oscillospiraceae bacterium]
MITKLYIIRHAEAEGNLYRRVHGHYDANITELGMRQIQALSDRFAGLPVDAIYSSDLVRAHTTAGAISIPRGLPVQTTEQLREVYMGRWEDTTWAALEREDAKQLKLFAADLGSWDIGDNESLEDLTARVLGVVTEIAKNHPGQTVCITTHANVIRALHAVLLGLPSNRLHELPYCDNTCVSLVEYADGELTARRINDASHLDPKISTFERQSNQRNANPHDTGHLDFLSFDLDRDSARYLAYRQETWGEVHGTLAGFTDEYLTRAAEHAAAHPRALVEAFLGDTPIGILELDTERDAEAGEGFISLFYLDPAYRGRGLAAQFLGHATSVYRSLGRTKLTLHVAEANEAAIGFYERYGFQKVGETEGVRGPLWVMEMDITVRVR